MVITPANVIYLGNVFRSTDNGDHWQQVTDGMIHRNLTSLATDSQGSVYAATTGGGVYRTTPNGAYWTSTALVDQAYAISINSRDHIFVRSVREGVLRSKDGGERWQAIGHGLDNAIVSTFVFSPSGYAYALTNQGLYRSVESTTAVQESSDIQPASFALQQNYPNPFNPSTAIPFSLPHSAFVTLRIYNTAGVEVATLVAEKLAAGEHRVQWQAQNMAAGVYFYRLRVGELVGTKKLILVK
jgi:hypothetical protein